jgi:hypothetical protein
MADNFSLVNSAGNSVTVAAKDNSSVYTPRHYVDAAIAGGCSIFRSLDLDESEEEVKATAGQVYSIHGYNANAAVRYLKLYNATAANVTVGTTTPVFTMPLEAQKAFNITPSMAMSFSTAITAAATTGLADNDTGVPSANDIIINVLYK